MIISLPMNGISLCLILISLLELRSTGFLQINFLQHMPLDLWYERVDRSDGS